MDSPHKKTERSYSQCHTAMLGTLMAIHSLEANFPDALDFWDGKIFMQYSNAVKALAVLGNSLYGDLVSSVKAVGVEREIKD